MRIIVADDHPVVLMGVRALLKSQGEAFDLVAEADSGHALLALLEQCPCDLLITDFSMPDDDGHWDGMSLLRRLRREHPHLPIVVLTMVNNPALVRGMLALGIHGVVDKAAMTKELLRAIHAIAAGRTYASAEGRPGSLETLPIHEKATAELAHRLSLREAEIVRLFVRGMTITQIAEHVNRSVKTVSQQKNDAMRKLGLESNSQLYEYATVHGLLS